MQKHILSVRTFMFAAIAALAFSVTGCDLGNNTKDTNNSGAEEGTIQEGDNLDDETAGTDTAAVDSFR